MKIDEEMSGENPRFCVFKNRISFETHLKKDTYEANNIKVIELWRNNYKNMGACLMARFKGATGYEFPSA